MSSTTPSKIIGIQFSILSPEEIRKGSVAQITTRDTYINNKPVINGLFDPRMGVLDPGLICPSDGLDYMQTPGYFGHIELARPVFYIQYLNTVIKILRSVCFKCSKLRICKEKYSYLLKKKYKERWDAVFKLASKITRCGEDIDCGCGTKQPNKIYKEGLATIFSEWQNLEGILDEEGNKKEKLLMKMTPEVVLKIFRRISDEDVAFMGFSPLWSRPDWMVCQVLAVPPPAVRPSVKHDAQQRSEDDISHIIVNIIKSNKTLQEKIEQNAAGKVIDDWTTVLQYYCATMIDNKIPGCAPVAQRSGRALKSIKERLIGKAGRVRGNLMGKRVDFSARSVITPDPLLSIKQLGVPMPIAKNITYPETVNKRNKRYLTKLLRNGPEIHPGAKILQRKSGENISLRYVDRNSIELQEGDVLHRHLDDGDAVLFNRQPTLHRMSMMAHYTKVMRKGNTFRMNVGDTKPYNADFDGDEMNMHGPQGDEAKAELMGLAEVSRQIISPANNASIIGIFQDSLLGANRFTRRGTKFDKRTAMNLMMGVRNINVNIFNDKKKEISSFDLISQILPPLSAKFKNKSFGDNENKKTSNNVIEIRNGKYLRGQMDKGTFSGSNGLIQSIFNDFGFMKSADFIDEIQDIVTEYMKSSAYSVGISDLIANKKTNNAIIKAIIKKKHDVLKLINQTHIGIFENNTGKTNREEFETRVNAILNKAQEEAGKIGRKSLSKNNRFVTMVNAGSKGNNINIAQMISCLGQQNVDGKRIPYGFEDRTLPHFDKFDDSPESRGFVENSFIQGLTPTELYFHAMGGRVGLIDTAVKTSQTGYIQRRLVKGLEDAQVHYDMTVRNNKGKILQFKYGSDAFDTTKVENQILPLTRMTIEEVYAHFQMSTENFEDEKYTVNFTKKTIVKMNKQKDKLIEKTQHNIDYMLKKRDEIMKNIFNDEDDIRVHLPVKFSRIITNIQNQLNIQSDSMVNITPLELYEKLEEVLNHLNTFLYCKPNELFKAVFTYYLSPKELLMVRRFNKKAISVLMETIILNYKRALIHPGEMVGIIAAQSIGEPTTQLTLNTFHFAGVASKSNVTRGVPRIEEILSLSENPKNPSLTIYLKRHEETDKQRARELMHALEYTNLRHITKEISIYFDPDDMNTLITQDTLLMEEYKEFSKLILECSENEKEVNNKISKWILRLEMDKSTMLDKNITMDDVHFALKNSYKNNISCIYSDLNSDKLVMRIRLDKSLTNKKMKSLDQADEIYKLKNIQENLLNNTILRGVKGIKKVIIRKMPNRVILKNGNYITEPGWVLDTIGTNLSEILGLDIIDETRSFGNDIREIHRTLGIEAARLSIFNELTEVLEFDGTYINYHHLELLCDRMCAGKKMCSIFRHGINNDDIGPLAKASFEETPEMFLRAAKHAELDEMRGISANVMCGQKGYYGTSSFNVLLNIKEMKKLGEGKLEEKVNFDTLLKIENPADPCSVQNIAIMNTTENIPKTNTGKVDDEYDPGF
jgi:DNA-directed RNA polymerase II subunit RPB1